jgi:hypothetical protein
MYRDVQSDLDMKQIEGVYDDMRLYKKSGRLIIQFDDGVMQLIRQEITITKKINVKK